MISITEENHAHLIWRKSGISPHGYELATTDNNTVGILRQSVDETISKTIQTLDGEWIVVGTKYLNPRISIWTPDRKLTALYEGNRTGSGKLDILNGKILSWIFQDLDQPEGVLRDLGSDLMIHFLPHSGGWRVRGNVMIENFSRGMNDIALIAVLGWLIISLDYSQTERILAFPVIGLI
jgi:hypothetical protein